MSTKLRLPQPPPEGVSLHWLADHPVHADALARLHHAQWGSGLPDWSLQEAQAELHDHAGRRSFPTTLLALADDALVGSVSLVHTDAPQFPEHTPWLASFWVDPGWRNLGIGEALLTRICFAARRWGFAQVWLYTDGVTRLYERCGFQVREQRQLFDRPVQLLQADLHG